MELIVYLFFLFVYRWTNDISTAAAKNRPSSSLRGVWLIFSWINNNGDNNKPFMIINIITSCLKRCYVRYHHNDY